MILVQFLRLLPLPFGYSPIWGRGRIRTCSLLVTSIRLRGEKDLREWKEAAPFGAGDPKMLVASVRLRIERLRRLRREKAHHASEEKFSVA